MAKLAILFFLSLCVVSQGAPISCPSAEDLHPCSCKRMAYGLHVICAKINRNVDLVRAFKVLRDYEVQNVLLHEVNMTEVLPSDLFTGMEISALRVEKSKLTFSEPAFTGLDESLHTLNVAQNSKIKSSDNFALAKLNKLTELNIKANPLGKVTNRWLNGKIPNVLSVTLDEDEITELESGAFAGLTMLTSISIAENRIKTVSRGMLPRPATHLTKIDLSGNEISKLPYDFFFEMPKLTEVILSGNDLRTLDQSTWTTVWEQLDAVVLFGATVVDADNLMSKLSTGVILCKLAKCIQRQADESMGKEQARTAAPMKFWDRARRETFFARDNAELFIRWCREFGVREAVLFESDGLVMQTQQRTVILCLLELARIAAGYGVLLPPPIQLSPTTLSVEEQGGSSEDELLFDPSTLPPRSGRCCWDSGCSSGGRSPDPGSKTSSPGSTLNKKREQQQRGVVLLVSKLPVRVAAPSPRVSPPRSVSGVRRETISSRLRSGATLSRSDSSIVSSRSSLTRTPGKERHPEATTPRRRKASPLDRRVSEIACQYLKDADRIRRLSEGHYSFLDKNVFLRMVRGQNVVVRIGGGWDTLEHFLSALTGGKTNLRRRAGFSYGG